MQTLSQIRAALPGFGFNDYLRHLKYVEGQTVGAAPLRIAILRTSTVEPLEPVLRLQLMLDGYAPTCWFGGYGQYVQEILDPAGALHRFKPDLVLMLLRLEDLLPDFVDRYPSAEWTAQLAGKARELVGLAGRAAADLSAQVIVQNASLASPYFGIFDAQHPEGQLEDVRQFNRALAEAAAPIHGVYVWDFDRFARAAGLDQLFDPKAWYVSRNPFKQGAYPAIGGDLLRYVRSVLGRVKKCVVVDLDNTLWGGVVGEDGLEGIQLGHTYPGNCYRDLQKALLRLHDRGILLAINSKNNEADALRVLNDHPDMLLRPQHFAATRINWQDKASNLRAIVRELNIGMDSVIFIDDNPAECDLVHRACPECDVVVLPDKPYLLPAAIESLRGVETIRLTDEDRRKTDMYRARAAQSEQAGQFANVEDFLRSLDLEVTIETATPYSIPRVAQLTQKTNQMNMTTRRYTEAQIARFAGDPRYGVYSVAARDRFADHGIIGVLIVELTDTRALRIDTFLLSCRVIGRGIEQAMLAFAADVARQRDAATLIGEFFRTPKNAPAAGFYEAAGLERSGPDAYSAGIRERAFEAPDHVRLQVRAAHADA